MLKKKQGYGYNERLFSNGIRGKLHISRFEWVKERLSKLNCQCERVVELGCFDAKTIDFLPTKPDLYVGFDAEWENGLSLAKKKWGGAARHTSEVL